jgi:hypothetical protein
MSASDLSSNAASLRDASAPATSPALPTPVAGAGSADLATDSNDPQELRHLLERARERLSFYESFDRMIGENLRRTGEMMAETVALREQAAHATTEATAIRARVEETQRQERERYRTMISEALAEVKMAQPVIDGMVAKLQSALAELTGEEAPPEETQPEAVEEEVQSATAPAGPPAETVTPPADDQPLEESAPEASREASPATPAAEEIVEATMPEEDVPEANADDAGPRVLDVIAHGVPSATTAIALQQVLRGIDEVTRVDAREFADGELRLHVECSAPVPDAPLTDWLSRNSGTLVSHNGKAIEVSFS